MINKMVSMVTMLYHLEILSYLTGILITWAINKLASCLEVFKERYELGGKLVM